jgi:hypothetical protein
MEVHLSSEKEARLRKVARRTGRNVEQIIEDAVDRLLDGESRFGPAHETAAASAGGRESSEHDDLIKGIDRLLPFERP